MLFTQNRHGFNNELIKIYKFRSMRTNMLDHAGVKLVTKGDLQVTKVGKFIRKTSIDELPQLFNVLKNQLLIVGLARPSAYRLIMIPLMSTYLILLGESAIIDSDHWRHYYLISGIIWGVFIAIKNGGQHDSSRQILI